MMNREPDLDDLLETIKKHHTERPALWWIAVITAALLIANLISFAAHEIYSQWQVKRVAEIMQEASTKQVEEMIQQQELQIIKKPDVMIEEQVTFPEPAEPVIQMSGEEQRMARQQEQICQFWTAQAERENSARNRQRRDIACINSRPPGN